MFYIVWAITIPIYFFIVLHIEKVNTLHTEMWGGYDEWKKNFFRYI